MADLELESIRHALEAARSGGFREVHLEVGDAAFSAVLPTVSVKTAARVAELNGAANLEAPLEEGPKIQPICATCVGYYRPSDGVLKVGGTVSKGDIVATITALGLANDVESSVEGEIVEILAEPEQPVEYGQPLVMVKES